MDLDQKFPYCLVNRPICAGGNPVPCWQLIETNEAIISNKKVYGVESIDLENGIIVLEDEETRQKYRLTSNDDSRKFNVYWKSNNEFERKPE